MLILVFQFYFLHCWIGFFLIFSFLFVWRKTSLNQSFQSWYKYTIFWKVFSQTWHDHSIDIYGSLTHILDWGTFHKRFLVRIHKYISVRITSQRAFSNQKIFSLQIKCQCCLRLEMLFLLFIYFHDFWRFYPEFSDFFFVPAHKILRALRKKIFLNFLV